MHCALKTERGESPLTPDDLRWHESGDWTGIKVTDVELNLDEPDYLHCKATLGLQFGREARLGTYSGFFYLRDDADRMPLGDHLSFRVVEPEDIHANRLAAYSFEILNADGLKVRRANPVIITIGIKSTGTRSFKSDSCRLWPTQQELGKAKILSSTFQNNKRNPSILRAVITLDTHDCKEGDRITLNLGLTESPGRYFEPPIIIEIASPADDLNDIEETAFGSLFVSHPAAEEGDEMAALGIILKNREHECETITAPATAFYALYNTLPADRQQPTVADRVVLRHYEDNLIVNPVGWMHKTNSPQRTENATKIAAGLWLDNCSQEIIGGLTDVATRLGDKVRALPCIVFDSVCRQEHAIVTLPLAACPYMTFNAIWLPDNGLNSPARVISRLVAMHKPIASISVPSLGLQVNYGDSGLALEIDNTEGAVMLSNMTTRLPGMAPWGEQYKHLSGMIPAPGIGTFVLIPPAPPTSCVRVALYDRDTKTFSLCSYVTSMATPCRLLGEGIPGWGMSNGAFSKYFTPDAICAYTIKDALLSVPQQAIDLDEPVVTLANYSKFQLDPVQTDGQSVLKLNLCIILGTRTEIMAEASQAAITALYTRGPTNLKEAKPVTGDFWPLIMEDRLTVFDEKIRPDAVDWEPAVCAGSGNCTILGLPNHILDNSRPNYLQYACATLADGAKQWMRITGIPDYYSPLPGYEQVQMPMDDTAAQLAKHVSLGTLYLTAAGIQTNLMITILNSPQFNQMPPSYIFYET